MNEAAEIIGLLINGFFTYLGALVVILLLLNRLHEIKNERRVKVWREEVNARRQV